MSLVRAVTPINLAEQKQLFEATQNYNPQFEYDREIDPAEINTYPKPKKSLLDLAQRIVDKAYRFRNEADLDAIDGAVCSEDQVKKTIASFLELHNLQKRLKVVYSHSFLTRTSITADKLKLRLPLEYRRESLIGMLYHEVGTHALRRINYEQQPWYKQKSKFGFDSYLETEEGLAALHSLIPKSNQLAYRSALRYLAVAWAQQGSFMDLWNRLVPYVQDQNRRWTIAVRQKRGITDTSQPGGFTKDALYFEGMVTVWRWLREHEYNPTDLYLGKLALADISFAKKLNPEFSPALPSFYSSNPTQYSKKMQAIGVENYFGEL